MQVLQSSESISVSVLPLSEDGPSPDESHPSKRMDPVDTSTRCPTLKEKLDCPRADNITKKRKASPMQGSAARPRKQTSTARSEISKSCIQDIESSLTSDQGSISKDPGLCPWWTQSSKDASSELWSCTETDSVASELTSWNESSKRLVSNSWFTTAQKRRIPQCPKQQSSQTTSLQLQPSLQPDTMVRDPVKTESDEGKKKVKTLFKTRSLRVFPNKKQKEKLEGWFNTARWTYNQLVEFSKKNPKVKCTKTELRGQYLNSDSLKKIDAEWALGTPYEIRDSAVLDLTKAKAALWAKYKKRKRNKEGNTENKQPKPSEFKFRSRKDATQSIQVLKKTWGTKRGVYHDVFNSSKLRAEKPLPETLEHDTRLVRTRLGKYYISIQVAIKAPSVDGATEENQFGCLSGKRVIALDPGVRTFMTGYDKDGVLHEWGTSPSRSRMVRLCLKYDRVRSKMDHKATRSRLRCRLRKVSLRLQVKIRNLVQDIHRKLSKWLCENYDHILIPVFGVQRMVSKSINRRLNGKTSRMMLCWSHFSFKQRLLSKSEHYPKCNVHVVTEEYTSKTCGICGLLNSSLGSSKTFKCPHCSYRVDRDANGARNILLKHCL